MTHPGTSKQSVVFVTAAERRAWKDVRKVRMKDKTTKILGLQRNQRENSGLGARVDK